MIHQTIRTRHSLHAHLLLLAVTLVWGTTFPVVKWALRDASPLVFNALRMTLAGVVLIVLNARALGRLGPRQLTLCATAGAFLALGYALQTTGLAYTTPSKSAFLTGLVVVLVPLLSRIPGLAPATSSRPGSSAYLGALFALFGVILLTSEPGAGFALVRGMHRGEWLTLGCAFAFAMHLLTLARAGGVVSARVLGTLQIVCAAGLMAAALPLDRPVRLHWTTALILALLVTALLGTAAAFTIQSWAQQYLPATHTALVLSLEPVFAWLFSMLFLGEHLVLREFAGAGLILGGILLAELGPTVFTQAGILPVEP